MKENEMYYLFDNGGILISSFNSLREISNKLDIKYITIYTALKRSSCMQLKYYVSNDFNFDVNSVFKKSNFNPVLSKQKRNFNVGGLIDCFDNNDEFLNEY